MQTYDLLKFVVERSNVPVKLKLKHASSWQPPGIWIFGNFLFKFFPNETEKLFNVPSYVYSR